MKNTLKEFLLKNKYISVKLKLTKTNHFRIKATINGVKGDFILDTGASSCCVGFNTVDKFNLKTKTSDIKATGAGSNDITTKISKKNSVKIGKWQLKKVPLIVIDTSHINTALEHHGAKPIDGIIGSDILKKGHGIIDYEKKYLYLKE